VIRRALLLAAFAVACKGTDDGRPHYKGGVQQPVTRATITLVGADAQPVVDAWANAVGGVTAIERLGAWHAKGTLTKGGVTGTIEQFQSPTGARKEILELGFLREERIYDGTRGWLVDRNREVRELAGFELDDQRAHAFTGVWAPILPSRVAGSVEKKGEQLVLTPRNGNRPDTVSFDPQTKLPATLVRRDGEKQRITTWSDYKVVHGVQMPHAIREENGNPNDAVTIRWTEIKRAELDAKLFERPADRTPDVALALPAIEVPIEIVYGGLIFMQVRINDQPMSFVLDTGAEATVLNSSRLPKLGLQGFGRFATGAGGGDVEIAYVERVTTKVGDDNTGEIVVKDQIVAAVLLDALEAPLRRKLDGILGYDFISRFVLEIDYKNQTLRLFDRASYRHKGAGTPQPMTLEDSTPFIDAAIEVPGKGKVSGRFVLDTGCLCDVQLFTPFVDRHDLLTAFPEAKQTGYSAGAGGETHEVSAVIPSLTVGDRVIDKPKADMSRDTHGAGADPESAGLIGSVTFGRFILVLDYKRQLFYLDPAP